MQVFFGREVEFVDALDVVFNYQVRLRNIPMLLFRGKRGEDEKGKGKRRGVFGGLGGGICMMGRHTRQDRGHFGWLQQLSLLNEPGVEQDDIALWSGKWSA